MAIQLQMRQPAKQVKEKLNKLFINGEWVNSSGNEYRDLINPFTEETIAQVVRGTEEDVQRASEAAKAAFIQWSRTPLNERLAVLERFYTLYRENAQLLAETMSLEMGAPISLSKSFLTDEVGDIVRNTIDTVRYFPHEEKVNNVLVIREAYGVIGAITPWNNPALFMVIKGIVAIAGGNTVIHKPAEMTPLNAYLLAQLLEEAGLPGGVYNLLPGRGSVVGEALVRSPDVDLISITGSTKAGCQVARGAAEMPKKCILELGGKSACIVLDDADLENVADESVRAIMSNSGQLCAAWSRLVVPRAKMDEITQKIVDKVAKMKLGDPMDSKTDIGPIVSQQQQQSILAYIHKGLEEGATLAIGDPESPQQFKRGYFVKPSVFTNVDNLSTIAQEEIFGPVLCIIPHDGDDDAVKIANQSSYGLHGGVMSASSDRAIQIARQIQTGQVDIKGFRFNVWAPFGGYKQSGYGRCMGEFGYEEYLQTKAILT